MTFPVLKPNTQIAFFVRLRDIRARCLSEALSAVVRAVDIKELDQELHQFSPRAGLSKLAQRGVRGEIVFATPLILTKSPSLLGYYRLLLGFSQKEFYRRPLSLFKTMELNGLSTEKQRTMAPQLCRSLNESIQLLLDQMEPVTAPDFNELQLLTLGAQLRGSLNNSIGEKAARQVFDLLKGILADHTTAVTKNGIILTNSSGRKVVIELGNDPDLTVEEFMASGPKKILSIEIKGGADSSNIHNRLGEAEKSHLSAKRNGFHDFWTILNVVLDAQTASMRSPTTTRFFNLSALLDKNSSEREALIEELESHLNLRLNKG
jgi:hypothetical protein